MFFSAYCGSLWLGALCSTVKMAEVVGDESTRVKFAAVLDKAKVAFEEKLWNGKRIIFLNYCSHIRAVIRGKIHFNIWFVD